MSDDKNFPQIPKTRPRLFWTPGRLALGRRRFAVGPLVPDAKDALGLAAVTVLHPDPAQRRHHGRLVADRLLAFEIQPQQGMRPDGNGCDQYRWNQWVAPALDWCWDYLTAAERDQVVQRYTGYVRTVMQQRWGGPGMAFNNYFAGNLTNEFCLAVATWHEQDVRDILDFALNTRWRKDFLPLVSARKNDAGAWEYGPNWGGGSPDGSGYGVVSYSYPILPWLTFPEAFGTDWFAQVVRTLAYWLSPVPMVARGSPTPYHQLFPCADDEGYNGFPNASRGNYLGDFLMAAQDLLHGRPEAGYARTLLDYGLSVTPFLQYGLDWAKPRPLADLPLDRWASFWDFWRQSWDPSATRIMLQLTYGAEHGPNHCHVGSFQIAKGSNWLTKEHTGYATRFVDCEAFDAEPHNVITFWKQQRPPYGYGPVRSGWRAEPVRDSRYSGPKYAYLSLDLTGVYRTNDPRTDNPDVERVIRQYLYLRDVDVLLVIDRLRGNRECLRRFHLNLTAKPDQQDDGSWLCPGGMVFRTLAPAHAEDRVIYMGYNGAPYPDLYGYRLDVCTHDDFLVHALCCSGKVPVSLDPDGKVQVGGHAVQLARGLSLERPKVDGVQVPAGA